VTAAAAGEAGVRSSGSGEDYRSAVRYLLTPNSKGNNMKRKLLRLAMCLGLAVSAVAAVEAPPAFASLSGCSGYATAWPGATANVVCNIGTTGLMRARIKYKQTSTGLIFTRFGAWVGNGQWSTAYSSCPSNPCTTVSWGWELT
jgi:hypothetical protein